MSNHSEANDPALQVAEQLWQAEYDATLNQTIVVFGTPFSFAQVQAATSEILAADKPVRRILFDFTQCIGIKTTTTELLNAGKEAASWGIQDGNKIALLAGSQSDAGLLRIVSAHFSELLVRVFLSRDESLRWLQVDGDKIYDSPTITDHKAIRLRGNITLDEILSAQNEVRLAEDYNPAYGILWDLRDAKIAESIDEVKELAVFIAGNHNRDRTGHRSAVLVDSHFMELIIREMFKVEEWPVDDVAVYRSYREAMAWLAAANNS